MVPGTEPDRPRRRGPEARKEMQKISLFAILVLTLSVALLSGCGEKVEAPGPLAMTPEEFEAWEIALVEMRIEKNEDFFRPATTPLRAEDLEGFEGLNYYFPKSDLRFKVPYAAEAGTDTVGLTKRKGQVMSYIRRGKVAFTYEGTVHQLDVFGPADASQGDYLWLPFFDATSGKDTYGGGRYLDVKIDDEGLVDLDFNYAYNPLCDYNPDGFNCTLPPAGNKLDFAVEAGEKSFSTDH
jgi:uncharacterized protein (DUF1684 family)